MKFRSLNHARAVSIDSLELSAQVLHLFLGSGLNEKIHSGLLKRRNAFEATKSCNDVITDLHLSVRVFLRLAEGDVKNLEPLVLQGSLTINSFLMIHDKELAD